MPAIFSKRRAGVLLHVTSLPGPHGIGDIGPNAHRFVDACARAGLSIWQMLPVGPVGPGNSPYASTSSFAGEPLLVSLDVLQCQGLLTKADCRPVAGRGGGGASDPTSVDYASVRAFKTPRLRRAYETWRAGNGMRAAAFTRWQRTNAWWLQGWCSFAASQRGAVKDLGFHAFVQWQFHMQWQELRAHSRNRGVLLLGDVPIFVPLHSADVQDHPELFRLDSNGKPTVVTGVPPDCFSTTGQRWGHPHYKWRAHQRTNFAWWTARVKHALTRFDALRIDHFVGFVHAYEISGRAKSARHGRWAPAPGFQLLRALRRACGALPLVAEDLGAVTPKVTALRRKFGLPGMRLVQNAFYGPDSPDLPVNHPVECVTYPGTHDNPTTVAWWQTLPPDARRHMARYALQQTGLAVGSARTACDAMIRITMQSPARTAVFPMQDILHLGAAARMNTPGKPRGQWQWRMSSSALNPAAFASIRPLARARHAF